MLNPEMTRKPTLVRDEAMQELVGIVDDLGRGRSVDLASWWRS